MCNELEFAPITIGDRDRVRRYVRAWGLQSSGYNFTTMLSWGACTHIRLAEREDMLFFMADHGCSVLFAPLTLRREDYPRAIAMASEHFGRICGEQPLFKGITEELAPYFTQAGCVLAEDRNNYDYVYNMEDLLTLAGKKFHGKRNHINQFLALHQYEYVPVTSDMRAECMAVYDAWEENKTDEGGVFDERQAIETIFAHMDELGVVGGGIRMDGKLAAFTLGEKMDAEMALIHIEKAADVQGLFALINREFIAHAFTDMRYINREEDMGLPGLRRAKLSYNPCKMLPKYIAVPQNEIKV